MRIEISSIQVQSKYVLIMTASILDRSAALVFGLFRRLASWPNARSDLGRFAGPHSITFLHDLVNQHSLSIVFVESQEAKESLSGTELESLMIPQERCTKTVSKVHGIHLLARDPPGIVMVIHPAG